MTAGIKFSETMRGPFALGTDMPQHGESLGRERGEELSIAVQLAIPDVNVFLNDRSASGQISGTVEFPPFGEVLSAPDGRFQLFSPSDHPDTRFMVYELGFEHAGKAHYLAGRKVVHDDPGFDIWSDTTTLYTRLHRGSSVEAPVIGAGILRLGVKEMVAMLGTLRSTGSGDLRTLARFGQFFFGEVWHLFMAKPGHDK